MLALTASMALPLLAGCSWISAPEAERPTETPALTAAAPMQQTAQPGETGGIRALTERALASAGDTYMLAVNVGKADAILLARGGLGSGGFGGGGFRSGGGGSFGGGGASGRW